MGNQVSQSIPNAGREPLESASDLAQGMAV